tara:strand:- start:38 stop:217 length:180 start_codon:yes stop_codon:yes gene_type:complete
MSNIIPLLNSFAFRLAAPRRFFLNINARNPRFRSGGIFLQRGLYVSRRWFFLVFARFLF